MEKQEQADICNKIAEKYKNAFPINGFPDVNDCVAVGFNDGADKVKQWLIVVDKCLYVMPFTCWQEINEVIDKAIKPLLVTLKSEALKKEDIKDLHKQYHKIKDPAEQRKCLHSFMQKNKSEWNINDRRKNIKTEIEKIFKKYNITDKRAMGAIFYNIDQDKQKCNNASWMETTGIIDRIVKQQWVINNDYQTVNNNIAQIMLFDNFMFLNDEIQQIAIKNQQTGIKRQTLKVEQLENKSKISVDKVNKYDIICIKDCSATLNSKSGTHDKIGIVINKEKTENGQYRIDCLFLNSNQYNTHDVSVNNSDLPVCETALPNGTSLKSNFFKPKDHSYISINSYELDEDDKNNMYICGHLMNNNSLHQNIISKIKEALEQTIILPNTSMSKTEIQKALHDFLDKNLDIIDSINKDECEKKKKKKHKHKNKKKKNDNDNNNIQEEDQKEENSEAKNEINDGNQLDDVMEKENNNNIPTLTSKNMASDQTLAKK